MPKQFYFIEIHSIFVVFPGISEYNAVLIVWGRGTIEFQKRHYFGFEIFDSFVSELVSHLVCLYLHLCDNFLETNTYINIGT